MLISLLGYCYYFNEGFSRKQREGDKLVIRPWVHDYVHAGERIRKSSLLNTFSQNPSFLYIPLLIMINPSIINSLFSLIKISINILIKYISVFLSHQMYQPHNILLKYRMSGGIETVQSMSSYLTSF